MLWLVAPDVHVYSFKSKNLVRTAHVLGLAEDKFGCCGENLGVVLLFVSSNLKANLVAVACVEERSGDLPTPLYRLPFRLRPQVLLKGLLAFGT